MSLEATTTLAVTILLALAGYLAKYLNDLRLAQRKDRLERINLQLRDLYGPLFALHRASCMAWAAFRSVYRPHGAFWGEASPPTEEEAAAWRVWMSQVFMPFNVEEVNAITEHADLLIEPELPQCLLDLCAHVAAYKPVLKAWESGDYSSHTSIIEYPTKQVDEYVAERYTSLKREQSRLLGLLGKW